MGNCRVQKPGPTEAHPAECHADSSGSYESYVASLIRSVLAVGHTTIHGCVLSHTIGNAQGGPVKASKICCCLVSAYTRNVVILLIWLLKADDLYYQDSFIQHAVLDSIRSLFAKLPHRSLELTIESAEACSTSTPHKNQHDSDGSDLRPANSSTAPRQAGWLA